MISLVTAAADTALLTIEQMRAAAGLAAGDQSKDTALEECGEAVAAAIARACGVEAAGATPPTLRQEEVEETLRIGSGVAELVLARRPVVEVATVVEAGVELGEDDYEILAASGILRRISSDETTCWAKGRIVATYTAGFDTVPADLRLAASKLFASFWSESGRDGNLKRVRIEGVSEREYWVPPTTDPAIPQDILDLLRPYTNTTIG